MLTNFKFKVLEKLFDLKESSSAKETIRKHWHQTAVFTDSPLMRRKKAVPKSKLLPGELSAETFHVGCYKVRSAVRVYNVDELGYCPENETPASLEDVEMIRRETDDGKMLGFGFQDWRDRLHVTHEISAKHSNNRSGEYTYLCRATEARNYYWCERITAICAAKKNALTPDNKAELFVCNTFIGDSHGAESWYKLSPSGKVERLYLHDYDADQDNARFK